MIVRNIVYVADGKAFCGQLRASLTLFVGSQDPMAPDSHRKAFEAEMTAAGADWRPIVFGGVSHAFTNPQIDARRIPGFAYNRSRRGMGNRAAIASSRAACVRQFFHQRNDCPAWVAPTVAQSLKGK